MKTADADARLVMAIQKMAREIAKRLGGIRQRHISNGYICDPFGYVRDTKGSSIDTSMYNQGGIITTITNRGYSEI